MGGQLGGRGSRVVIGRKHLFNQAERLEGNKKLQKNCTQRRRRIFMRFSAEYTWRITRFRLEGTVRATDVGTQHTAAHSSTAQMLVRFRFCMMFMFRFGREGAP